MSDITKQCQNCKQEFLVDNQDQEFYKKIQVPLPTFCWLCRAQRRMAFRNDRKLFWNQSSKSKRNILSLYPKESGATMYSEKEWWADDWDAQSYAREYDFSTPFFVQLAQLAKEVPRYNLDVLDMVNSDYSGNASHLKNCYLLFNSNQSEDSAYGNAIDYSHMCFNNSHLNKSERCYESFWLTESHRTFFSAQCSNCLNVWLSKNCTGCSNCFGCINLRAKQYCIFNVAYSKEEYEKRIKEMRLDTFEGLTQATQRAREFWLTFPNKYLQGVKNTQVSGEYITNSKNVTYSYLVRGGENLRYVQYLQVPPNKDCYDVSVWGDKNELAYENSVCGDGIFNVKFCVESWPEMRDSEYSMFCKSSSNLFGCVGLRKKSFSILNKQYSKDEYEALRKKIIEHMNTMLYKDKAGRTYAYGEFFPIELSLLPYNHSIAAEHFPLTETQVRNEGWFWLANEAQEYQTTRKAAALPSTSQEVDESIIKEVIECLDCKKAYRIIQPELTFLQEEHLPLPRLCPDCRHARRIAHRNSFKLFSRTCQCAGLASENNAYKNAAKHFHDDIHCSEEFLTSFAPDRPEIVYCEQCYQAEIA